MHAWTLPYSAHQYTRGLSHFQPLFFIIITPRNFTFYCRFFNVYTDQPVPAHSRLVYRLSVINLIHAYPGTYMSFAFTLTRARSHH